MKKSAAASAFFLLPSYLVLGQKASDPQVPPSERVALAVIGIGNRGNGCRKEMLNSGHCTVVALCDVDLNGPHTQEALQAHPDARRFTDFRKMFAEMADDIDAVVVATPDHAHFCAAMLAMSLGKHVYVEKPLAHSFGQCERLMRMAQKSGVVTQMGNQGHSGPNYFQFKAWTEAGLIKNVTRITAHMNMSRRWHGWGTAVTEYPNEPMPEGLDWEVWMGPSKAHPFSRKLHPQEWRSWYDYGNGAFGDWGPHLLDTAHRFLNLGLPTTVAALKRDGYNPLVYPQASTIRFDFPGRDQMPPCVVTWYDGLTNLPVIEPELGALVTDPESGVQTRKPIEIKAPGKIIYSDDLVFQGASHGSPLQILPREKYMDMRASLPKFPQKNSDHVTNFLLACKGEEEARSPFSVSGPLCQVFALGVIAQRLGETLTFDRERQQITNSTTANALLDPEPRTGWEEFYKL